MTVNRPISSIRRRNLGLITGQGREQIIQSRKPHTLLVCLKHTGSAQRVLLRYSCRTFWTRGGTTRSKIFELEFVLCAETSGTICL